MDTTLLIILLVIIVFPLTFLMERIYKNAFGNLSRVVAVFVGIAGLSVIFLFADPVRMNYILVLYLLFSLVGIIRTMAAAGKLRSPVWKKI